MIDDFIERINTGKQMCTLGQVELTMERGFADSSMQPPSYGTDTLYELRLRVGTRFAANDITYDKAEQYAIAKLKRELYKDIIEDLYALFPIAQDRPDICVKIGAILDKFK